MAPAKPPAVAPPKAAPAVAPIIANGPSARVDKATIAPIVPPIPAHNSVLSKIASCSSSEISVVFIPLASFYS